MLVAESVNLLNHFISHMGAFIRHLCSASSNREQALRILR